MRGASPADSRHGRNGIVSARSRLAVPRRHPPQPLPASLLQGVKVRSMAACRCHSVGAIAHPNQPQPQSCIVLTAIGPACRSAPQSTPCIHTQLAAPDRSPEHPVRLRLRSNAAPQLVGRTTNWPARCRSTSPSVIPSSSILPRRLWQVVSGRRCGKRQHRQRTQRLPRFQQPPYTRAQRQQQYQVVAPAYSKAAAASAEHIPLHSPKFRNPAQQPWARLPDLLRA